MSIGTIVFLTAGSFAVADSWAYWMGWEIRWIGATFATVGVLMLIGSLFRWILGLAALIAGAIWLFGRDLPLALHRARRIGLD